MRPNLENVSHFGTACRKSIYVLSVFLAIAGTLNADTISYSFTTPDYPNKLQTAPWSETISLPKFDLPGATLTGINFNLTAFINMSVQGTNTGTTTATYRYHSDGVVIAYPVGHYLPFGISVWLPDNGAVTEPPGPFAFDTGIKTGTTSYSFIQGAGNPAFAEYVGTGTTNLGIFGEEFGPDGDAPGPYLWDLHNNPTGRGVNNSAAKLTVTYTYISTVPEPATGTQFACAFLLLGCGVFADKLRRSAL